jgi:glycosyltransferase involved in cell wall biosynthesis
VDAKTLVDHMQRAKAMVFAAEEDFGIAPVEAQACGTPIIAFGRGGSLETVNGIGVDRTGVFFAEQSIESICAAVTEFEGLADSITPQACRSHAEKFSIDAFKRRIASFVDAKWTELRGTRDRVEVWE